MSDEPSTATEQLAELQCGAAQRWARVDEAEARAAGAARAAARAALVEAERRGVSQAQRHRLEEQLAAAERRAAEPWPERHEAARLAAGDADRRVQEFVGTNLRTLVDALEAEGRVVAERVNTACVPRRQHVLRPLRQPCSHLRQLTLR